MTIDFGKYGKRLSYGRFTQHPIAEVKGRLVLGVLNFEPKKMVDVVSEALGNCRTIHEPAAKTPVRPRFELIFDQ